VLTQPRIGEQAKRRPQGAGRTLPLRKRLHVLLAPCAELLVISSGESERLVKRQGILLLAEGQLPRRVAGRSVQIHIRALVRRAPRGQNQKSRAQHNPDPSRGTPLHARTRAQNAAQRIPPSMTKVTS